MHMNFMLMGRMRTRLMIGTLTVSYLAIRLVYWERDF